ncbi:hypothetical protein [Rubrivivax gelatinosus]|uniref:hypothetical protein n=1 Tax=Rubrivivax gelatinosus TaxID=28068 RepID=UPI0002EB9E69|nr:hypothetical protein [Rubrivivax gelatinosus]MBG6081263.1 hypothetical protein [Rubrivivax gelatinosus]
MTVIRSLSGLLAAATIAALGGCYVPSHVPHALLEVSVDGAYKLEGLPVDTASLAAAVAEHKAPGSALVVEIKVTPGAPMTAVDAAVATIEKSQARVAFIGATAAR